MKVSLLVGLVFLLFGTGWAEEISGKGAGLRADYFENPNLTKKVATEDNKAIDVSILPAQITDPSRFSVRWTGYIQPQVSDTYTFYVNTSGGVRLWIDDNKLTDDWTSKSAPGEHEVSLALTGGVLYTIRVEYFYDDIEPGNQEFNLEWKRSTQAVLSDIPMDQLFTAYPLVYAAGKPLYVGFEEDFQDEVPGSGTDEWEDCDDDEKHYLRATEDPDGKAHLTLQNNWGKIVRRHTSFITVDLDVTPILRLKVDSISDPDTTWALDLYQTEPEWVGPIRIQTNTAATGVYDYDIPQKTGWSGKQRFQVAMAVAGASSQSVVLDFLQFGNETEPLVPEISERHNILAMIGIEELSADQYRFTALGEKVYDDGRTESYDGFNQFTWDLETAGIHTGQILNSVDLSAHPGPLTVLLEAQDTSAGITQYAVREIKTDKAMYADYFTGYRSREYSGRSDLWWWYAPEKEKAPWSARPGDLYEKKSDGTFSTEKKQTIAPYNPIIGNYDQWDPAAIEYTMLLAKMVGLDGFAFEYQDNRMSPAMDLMDKMVPYARQFGIKMTLQWIPSTILAWRPEIETRAEMNEIARGVMKRSYERYIEPTKAFFKVNGVNRPLWFIFNWSPEESLTTLPEEAYNFGYSGEEVSALKTYITGPEVGAENPLFMACSWSFWPEKWDSQNPDPVLSRFPRYDVYDGLFGWIHPGKKEPNQPGGVLSAPIPAGDSYYLTHNDLTGYGPDYGQGKTDVMRSVDYNLHYLDTDYAEQQNHPGDYEITGGTAFAGFDDAHNGAWGEGLRRYIPRQDADGYTIDQSMARLQTNNADIGLYATFADWAEGTTLEPSIEEQYTITIKAAAGIAAWKGTNVDEVFLAEYLPFIESVYRLRKQHDFLEQSGCGETELKSLKQAIDDIVPEIIKSKRTQNIAVLQITVQTALDLAGNMENSLEQDTSLTLQWADENQAAIPEPDAIAVDMAKSPEGNQQFFFPESVKRLLSAGYYKDGKITLEYKDEGLSWLAARVNTPADLEAAVNDTIEILKVQKTDTGEWTDARADYSAASFDKAFTGRPDVTFESQGGMIPIKNYQHPENALTIALWAKNDILEPIQQNYVTFVNSKLGYATLKLFSENNDLKIEFYIVNKMKSAQVSNALLTDTWQHLAITWDGTDLYVYVDGISQTVTDSTISGILDNSTDHLDISSYKGGLQGSVDDLQIYNRALSTGEVGTLRLGGAVSGLTGRWRMEEGSGYYTEDSSTRNNRGEMYNGTMWSDDVPPGIGSTHSVEFSSGTFGPQVRKVLIELPSYRNPGVLTDDFIVSNFEENFENLDAWNIAETPPSLTAVKDAGDSVYEFFTIDNKTAPGESDYGSLILKDTSFSNIDVSKRPVLRLITEAVPESANSHPATWGIWIADKTEEEGYANLNGGDFVEIIQYVSAESGGVTDFDLNDIISWPDGPDIRTIGLKIGIVGEDENGTDFVSRSARLDYLAIGFHSELPINQFGFVEDFSQTAEWTANGVTTTVLEGDKTSVEVDSGGSEGYLEREITVNLDTHPVLATGVTAADAEWKLVLVAGAENIEWTIKPWGFEFNTLPEERFEYDITRLTDFSGLNTFKVQYCVRGKTGTGITIDDLKFIRYEDAEKALSGWRENFKDISEWRAILGDFTNTTTQPYLGIVTAGSNPADNRQGKTERKQGRDVSVNLDEFPFLKVRIDSIEANGRWQIQLKKKNASVPGESQFFPENMSGQTGNFSFNVKESTGWSGDAELNISLWTYNDEGDPAEIHFDTLELGNAPQAASPIGFLEDFESADDWTASQGSTEKSEPGITDFVIGSDGWGNMYLNWDHVPLIDLGTYNRLEIKVDSLSAGTQWRLDLIKNGDFGNPIQIQPTFVADSGVHSYNLAAFAGLKGTAHIGIGIHIIGPEAGRVGFDYLKIVRDDDDYPIKLDIPVSETEQPEYNDAACLKMIVDYQGVNTYTQSGLHTDG